MDAIVGRINRVVYNIYTADNLPIIDPAAIVVAYLQQETGSNAGKWWDGAAAEWVDVAAGDSEPVAAICTIQGQHGKWVAEFPAAVWELGATYSSEAYDAVDQSIAVSIAIICVPAPVAPIGITFDDKVVTIK